MFLGIDLGTSAVKIVLINEEQQVVGQNQHPLRLSRPQPLWAEQNPADWWQATTAAMAALKQTHRQALSQVRAIGLSGQMHGATLLDQQGQVLRPAMLWNDGRAVNECQLLLAREPKAVEITANLIFPGFTAAKVLWVAKHEPVLFAQIHKVLLPKDYLRYQLSGVYATDLSDASGTSWLNVAERTWSEAMLIATGLSCHQMPELFEGPAITATIKPAIAAAWGLSPTVVIVAGGGDNAASAISMGVTEPGQAFLSLGTSGVYFVADDRYHPNPHSALHTMCHCIPERWHQMSVQLSAADCLDWAAKWLKLNNVAELIPLAAAHQPQATPLFLPYLSGERTPHNNPYARGVFFGLTHQSGAAEMAQAVLEGVALACADNQAVILAAGTTLQEVAVIGGGAHSDYWGRLLSAALNRPLDYREQATIGGAFGAARLAWLGIHGGNAQTAFTAPTIRQTLTPDLEQVAIYQEKLILFRRLYQQLKPSFTELHHLLP